MRAPLGSKERPVGAIVFDYGNTLIEFTHTQLARIDVALQAILVRHYGPVDQELFRQIRHDDRSSPYTPPYRENEMPAITAKLVMALYGETPSPPVLDELLEARLTAFVAAVESPSYLEPVLADLASRLPLALLSNYPCSDAIRQSLAKLDLTRHFATVVVSADVGHVKPHALPFARVVETLGVPATACVIVGDNWLGDIQGGKRAGMRAVLTTQFETPEVFAPEPGDAPPDATIGHLQELLALV